MKTYLNVLYLILLITISCKSQNHELKREHFNPKAVVLNNLAVKISENINDCNKDSILKSINLLEQAISTDSSYYLAYGNEAKMYCKLKKYNKAIDVLNGFLNTSHKYVELLTYKGYIFEKIGNIDSATKVYMEAINEYDKKLENDSSNISIKLNRAVLYLFTEGESKGKMEYNKIYKAFPNDQSVKGMRGLFYTFQRKSYIDGLFSDCN